MSIYLDGLTAYLTNSGTFGYNNVSTYRMPKVSMYVTALVKPFSVTGNHDVFSQSEGGASNGMYALGSNGTNLQAVRRNTAGTTNTLTVSSVMKLDQWNYIGGWWNGTATQGAEHIAQGKTSVSKNSAAVSSSAIGSFNRWCVGGRYTNTIANLFYGLVAEVVVYGVVPSSTNNALPQLSSMSQQYLGGYWNGIYIMAYYPFRNDLTVGPFPGWEFASGYHEWTVNGNVQLSSDHPLSHEDYGLILDPLGPYSNSAALLADHYFRQQRNG